MGQPSPGCPRGLKAQCPKVPDPASVLVLSCGEQVRALGHLAGGSQDKVSPVSFFLFFPCLWLAAWGNK